MEDGTKGGSSLLMRTKLDLCLFFSVSKILSHCENKQNAVKISENEVLKHSRQAFKTCRKLCLVSGSGFALILIWIYEGKNDLQK